MYDSINGNHSTQIEDPYTLTHLRNLMKKFPDKNIKFFGAEEYTICDVISWRGCYNIPCIEPMIGTRKGKDILFVLDSRIGDKMVGYKGGEYPTNGDDVFFVSHYGYNSYYKVVSYTESDDDIILNTKIDENY